MNFTPELVRVLFKHLEPLIETRWERENALLEAGFVSGPHRLSDDPGKPYPEAEIERTKAMALGAVGISHESEKWQRAQEMYRRMVEAEEEIRRLPPEQCREIQDREERARREKWFPLYEKYKPLYARDVAQFSSALSRAESDEELYEKIMQDFADRPVSFVYEDSLQKRIEIIRTLIEQELGPMGFELDRKLSSIKNLVYCKPFHGEFRLFVATDRSSLNPKKIEYTWPLGFCFGIHAMHEKWPGAYWNVHEKRWPFLLDWFMFGNFYHDFKYLSGLELSVRFHLFGYKLIANEFESALRAGFAEAEALGLIAPDRQEAL